MHYTSYTALGIYHPLVHKPELSLANWTVLKAFQHVEFPREISSLTLKSKPHYCLTLVRQLRLFLDKNQLSSQGFPICCHPHIILCIASTFTHHNIAVVWIPPDGNSTAALDAIRKMVHPLTALEACWLQEGSGQTLLYTTTEKPSQCHNTFEVNEVNFTHVLHVWSSDSEWKAYICLFTYAVSRAIHYKVIVDFYCCMFFIGICQQKILTNSNFFWWSLHIFGSGWGDPELIIPSRTRW